MHAIAVNPLYSLTKRKSLTFSLVVAAATFFLFHFDKVLCLSAKHFKNSEMRIKFLCVGERKKSLFFLIKIINTFEVVRELMGGKFRVNQAKMDFRKFGNA